MHLEAKHPRPTGGAELLAYNAIAERAEVSEEEKAAVKGWKPNRTFMRADGVVPALRAKAKPAAPPVGLARPAPNVAGNEASASAPPAAVGELSPSPEVEEATPQETPMEMDTPVPQDAHVEEEEMPVVFDGLLGTPLRDMELSKSARGLKDTTVFVLVAGVWYSATVKHVTAATRMVKVLFHEAEAEGEDPLQQTLNVDMSDVRLAGERWDGSLSSASAA